MKEDQSFWGSVLELFKSKKFKVAVATVAGIVCSAVAEKITWTQAGAAIVPVVITYLASQGIADIGVYLGKGMNGKTKPSEEDPTPPKP